MPFLSGLSLLQKQKILFWGGISVASLLVSCVVWNLAFAGSQGVVNSSARTEKVLTGASRLNPQDAWNERLTNQISMQEKQIAQLQDTLKTLNENLIKNQPQPSHKQEPLKSSLTAPTLNGITHQALEGSVLPIGMNMPTSSNNGFEEINPHLTQKISSHQKERFRSNGISKQQISLTNSKLGKNLDTVDTMIPPGSFAQGVLLSGVDANTSTSASANPEPVLIELTDSGDLSRHFTSTVKGCRVTASGYGDISKERVMMRLEKLSCIEVQTGEVVVADVDGYVSGEDGKLGVRGTVVDRAGDHVRAAMVGGFMSSFGNFLAGASNPVTFAPSTGLAQVGGMSNADMLKHGAAKGVSGALEKYTEFYIKRAEQLEPVIQIGAGRIVQVVFNKTVSIGKSALKQAISTRNDVERKNTIERPQS